MKNPTSLVTAILNRDTGKVRGIVDEDGEFISVSDLTTIAPVALTANRVLEPGDNGSTFYNNTATARNVTFGSNLPAGFSVKLVQKSTGTLTPVAGAGVTITSKDGFTKTGGANSTIMVTNSGPANDYLINGQGVA